MNQQIPDPLSAAVDVLLFDTKVSRIVDDRVYGGELPKREAGQLSKVVIDGPAIVVRGSGGGSIGQGARGYSPWTTVRLDITSYGKFPEEAMRTHWAVYQALTGLERRVLRRCILHNATVTGGPIEGRDGDTGWPTVLGVYDLSAVPIN